MNFPAGASLQTASRPPSWWQRNWKWFVPVGCLGLLGAVAVFVAVLLLVVFGFIKSAEPARFAVATAQADARVRSALGEPVEQGFWVSGSVNVSGPTGVADLALPISGPQESGTLYVVAEKRAGRWHYQVLEVEVDDSPSRIDLRAERAAPR